MYINRNTTHFRLTTPDFFLAFNIYLQSPEGLFHARSLIFRHNIRRRWTLLNLLFKGRVNCAEIYPKLNNFCFQIVYENICERCVMTKTSIK